MHFFRFLQPKNTPKHQQQRLASNKAVFNEIEAVLNTIEKRLISFTEHTIRLIERTIIVIVWYSK